jgi:hypothetical protein
VGRRAARGARQETEIRYRNKNPKQAAYSPRHFIELTVRTRYLARLLAVTLFAVAPALGWEHWVDGAAAWPLAARAPGDVCDQFREQRRRRRILNDHFGILPMIVRY